MDVGTPERRMREEGDMDVSTHKLLSIMRAVLPPIKRTVKLRDDNYPDIGGT